MKKEVAVCNTCKNMVCKETCFHFSSIVLDDDIDFCSKTCLDEFMLAMMQERKDMKIRIEDLEVQIKNQARKLRKARKK